MSLKEVTKYLTFEDVIEKYDTGFSQRTRCKTIIRCAFPILLHSLRITTAGYYRNETENKGPVDGVYFKAIHADGTVLEYLRDSGDISNTFAVNAWGSSSPYHSIPLLIEKHEVIIPLPKQGERKKIKEIHMWYTQSFYTTNPFQAESIEVSNIQAYALAISSDSGIRVQGKDGRIYKILDSPKQSSLKFKISNDIKNIELIPLSEAKNTQLRVKTRNGVMAIAIEET